MSYPRLAARLYGTPLLVHPEKARVIEEVFRAHLEGRKPRLMEDDEETPEQRAQREQARRTVAYAGISLQNKPEKPYALTTGGVALIPVLGTLVQRGSWLDAMSGLSSYDRIASLIDRASADPDVRALLLEIDSPGGEGSGIVDMASRVESAAKKRPLWAQAAEQAYSAAYWIAATADRVYAPITGGVGSIGAVALHVDQSKRDSMMGLKYEFIFDGDRKVDGNPHEPLNDSARAWIQAEVSRFGQLFRSHVAKTRYLSEESVRETQAGLLTPPEALAGGFLDGVQSLLDTVTLLERELAQGTPLVGARMAATRVPKETTMSKQQQQPGAATETQAEAKHTDEQLQAARTEARAEGEKAGEAKGHSAGRTEGVAAERARIAGILGAPEAEGRTELALHLSLQTDTNADDAKKLLAAAAKSTVAPTNPFAAAMAAAKNPTVGADADITTTGAPGRPSSTSEIYASRKQARGAAS